MVTLTGTFTRLDGSPATGTVRVTPSRSPILDSAGRVVISGPQVFPLDQDGKLTTEIPASNDPDLGPPFTYAIDVNLAHASWKISKVWIPHGSSTVDLSEIGDYQPVPGVATRVVTIPADGTDGQVLVWDGAGFSWMDAPEGPQGPPGEVTTAALTTALAGKVTGTGMTVRVDNSVGTRVLLDHPGGTTMLHGDTGWRDVTNLLNPNWKPATMLPTCRIRRIGDIGHLEARVEAATHLGLNVSVIRNLLDLPTGWRADLNYSEAVAWGRYKTFQAALTLFQGPQHLSLQIPDAPAGTVWEADPVTIVASWPISQAWPTALPGIPS